MSIKCLTFLRPMGLCYYALGWRKVPRLETTTVTYYHTEYTMNKGFDNIIVVKDMKEAVNASYQIAKGFDNIGDRLKEDSCFYL